MPSDNVTIPGERHDFCGIVGPAFYENDYIMHYSTIKFKYIRTVGAQANTLHPEIALFGLL